MGLFKHGKKTVALTDSQGYGVAYDYSQLNDIPLLLTKASADIVRNRSKKTKAFEEEIGKILISFYTNYKRIESGKISPASPITTTTGGTPR